MLVTIQNAMHLHFEKYFEKAHTHFEHEMHLLFLLTLIAEIPPK